LGALPRHLPDRFQTDPQLAARVPYTDGKQVGGRIVGRDSALQIPVAQPPSADIPLSVS